MARRLSLILENCVCRSVSFPVPLHHCPPAGDRPLGADVTCRTLLFDFYRRLPTSLLVHTQGVPFDHDRYPLFEKEGDSEQECQSIR